MILSMSDFAHIFRRRKSRDDSVEWNHYDLNEELDDSSGFIARVVRALIAKFSRTNVITLLIVASVAVYASATQFTGAPNYNAIYNDVLPPKGAFGPVTIRRNRNDQGQSGYGSKMIAVSAAAIEDELSRGWCPSETILTPSSLRTDTCAFQLGKHQVLADSLQVFKQQKIGYKGTANNYAPDLVIASGNLNFSPDIWGWFYDTTRYLRNAVKELRAYNTDLVEGKTGFNADLYKLNDLLEVFVDETEGEASILNELEVNDFILVGSSRAAFAHARGVFAMTCELAKAFEVDAFKVINDRNAWDFIDVAKTETCRAARVPTPFISPVGIIGNNFQDLKGAAEISHARLSAARYALVASNH